MTEDSGEDATEEQIWLLVGKKLLETKLDKKRFWKKTFENWKTKIIFFRQLKLQNLMN